MKILVSCYKCIFESGELEQVPKLCFAEYDEELCQYKCSKGHITYTWIENDRYELLFDSSIIAYLDSNYRESVLNASSSLESFYEHMIKAILFILKKDNLEKIDEFYKKIKSRSECREGVFQALCRVYFDKEYFLNNDSKNLRNNTIHNGYFPKRKETYNYLKEIYTIIYDCFNQLIIKTAISEYVDFVFALRDQVLKKYPVFYTHQYIPTILSNNDSKGNFEKEIENFRQRSIYIYDKSFKDYDN